jgi:hypothetical protein
VRVTRPWVVIVKDRHLEAGTLTPAAATMLSRHGLDGVGALGARHRLRFREGAIEEGEIVVACGVGAWEPDPDPNAAHGYREAAQRLVIHPPQGAPLLVSDEPDLVSLPAPPRRADGG